MYKIENAEEVTLNGWFRCYRPANCCKNSFRKIGGDARTVKYIANKQRENH